MFTIKGDYDLNTKKNFDGFNAHVLKDDEEGLEYIVVSTDHGVAITPRLMVSCNGRGLPYVTHKMTKEKLKELMGETVKNEDGFSDK